MEAETLHRPGWAEIQDVGVCHGNITYTVAIAVGWCASAAERTRERADKVAWHKAIADITGEMLAGDETYWPGRPAAPPVIAPVYVSRLEVLHDGLDRVALAWRSQFVAERQASVRLIDRLHKHMTVEYLQPRMRHRYHDSRGESGCKLLRDLDEQLQTWAAAVDRAAGVGVSAALLDGYASAVRDVIAQVRSTLRDVYAIAVSATHPLVEDSERLTNPKGFRCALRFAKSDIEQWMKELEEGGWSAAERDVVLGELERTHSAAVAVYRQSLDAVKQAG